MTHYDTIPTLGQNIMYYLWLEIVEYNSMSLFPLLLLDLVSPQTFTVSRLDVQL